MTKTLIFEDNYERVKIEGVEYRIFGDYTKEQILKWDRFKRKKRLLIVEQAKPFPITKTERYFLHQTSGGTWGMFAIDNEGKHRKFLKKVEFI